MAMSKLSYLSAHRLERIASLKIVTQLWRKDGVKKTIKEISSSKTSEWELFEKDNNQKWMDLVHDVIEDSKKLIEIRPEVRKVIDEVFPNVIYRVGLELREWIKLLDENVFHDSGNSKACKFIDDIAWRSDDLIDYMGTAETLMKDEKIDEKERFRIACLFCMEDEMTKLLKRIDARYKRKLDFDKDPLQYYWCSFIKDDLKQAKQMLPQDWQGSVEEYMLTSPYNMHNRCAAMYFWNKIDKANRIDWLISKFENMDVYATSIMFSEMNVEEQARIFREVGPAFFVHLSAHHHCFVHFLRSVTHYLDDMTEEVFREIFVRVLNEIHALDLICGTNEIEYYRYVQAMEELWKLAPAKLRDYIFQFQDGVTILLAMRNISWEESSDEMLTLFAGRDYESIKKVVFHADAMNFVYSIAQFNLQVEGLCIFMKKILKPEDMIRFEKEYKTELMKKKYITTV